MVLDRTHRLGAAIALGALMALCVPLAWAWAPLTPGITSSPAALLSPGAEVSWTPYACPPPGPRQGGAVAYDSVHRRLYWFGGHDETATLNDVWVLDTTGPPAWSQLSPAGTPPPARQYHTLIYDPVRDRLVSFGGALGEGPSTLNDTWALELNPTPRWEPLLPSGTPPDSRLGHTAIYDPVRDRMVVTGGLAAVGDLWALSGLFALEFGDSLRWSQIVTADGVALDRSFHTAIYDPVRDQMVVFAGAEQVTYGSVWALSLADPVLWKKLLPAGSGPANRRGHVAVYDPARDCMIVYGGNTQRLWDNPGEDLDDVWAAALGDSAYWVPLVSSGPMPGGRAGHVAFLEAETGRMVVLGGVAGGTLLADAWRATVADAWPAAVDAPTESRLAIRSIRPNPARGVAAITFSLPTSEAARLEVFDIAGRRVTRHDIGAGAAGPRAVEVGRTARLEPGLYLVRLEQAGRSAGARMIVTR
jgi:hypothetical protein